MFSMWSFLHYASPAAGGRRGGKPPTMLCNVAAQLLHATASPMEESVKIHCEMIKITTFGM
jgi:hypothetical protein